MTDTFPPAADFQAAADTYRAEGVAPVQAQLDDANIALTETKSELAATTETLTETQEQLTAAQQRSNELAAALAACEAGSGPSKPSFGTPGVQFTVSTPAQLAQLQGKSILCPILLDLDAAVIDDFEQDITTGSTPASGSSIRMSSRVKTATLSRGLITASKPNGNVEGINGDGWITWLLEISNVVDGVNIGTRGGSWTDYGSWIHDLFQAPKPHSDCAAFNKAGAIRLYGTRLDAGVKRDAGSLACFMFSPGPIASFQGFGVVLLGGYPAINVAAAVPIPSDFLLQDSRFGPSTFPGGASIIANPSKHDAIRKGLVRTTMLDGSAVKIANGS